MNLKNYAIVKGIYNEEENEIKSNVVITKMISEIELIESADKNIWIDKELNLSMKIRNISNKKSLTIKSWLDPIKIKLVTNNLKINGEKIEENMYIYNKISGELIINISKLEKINEIEITHQVIKTTNTWENIILWFTVEEKCSNKICIISIDRNKKLKYQGCDLSYWRKQ